MSSKPILQVTDLSLDFGGLKALTDLSFDVHHGEMIALIGPNGAGKTTVFNCLNGIYRPQNGTISLEGQQLIGLSPSSSH